MVVLDMTISLTLVFNRLNGLCHLHVPETITFKCCLAVYKSLDLLASSYVADFCTKTNPFGTITVYVLTLATN